MLSLAVGFIAGLHPIAFGAICVLVLLGVYIFAMAMISKDEKHWHDTYAKELHNAYERMKDGKSN